MGTPKKPSEPMVSEARKRKLFRDLDRRDAAFIEKIEPFLKGL